MKQVIGLSLYLALGFFLLLMINITIPYFAFEDNIAFLKIKQWVINNEVWKTAFYTHVFSSCFCLLAGFTQFSSAILTKNTSVHRYMGYLYIITILLISGPSGFIMSIYANGGTTSQIAFITLSVLWMTTTYLGFHYAKKGDFVKHRNFLIRSYAFTLSALTLRAWKFGIVIFFRPHPMDLYQLVAWLGWIPNILLAEWYIRSISKKTIT